MSAYYNEIDPYAAEWLRNLILCGLIADGEVDERSIVEVEPYDLKQFTQCHFFAGIGVWSYAARLAGWDDCRPVWTGSCPCQPFSVAGRARGFDDERHLWPHWQHLIRECRPPVVFGEQVASKDGLAWLELVCTDLEGEGYAFAAVDTCAAGIGAPHIRQRLYWVADTSVPGLQGVGFARSARSEREGATPQRGGAVGRVADDDKAGRQCERTTRLHADGECGDDLAGCGSTRRMADTGCEPGQQITRGTPRDEEAHGRAGRDRGESNRDNGHSGDGKARGVADAASTRHDEAREHERGPSLVPARPAEHGGMVRSACPTNGHWRDADWLLCRDGKWRPVEPGTFPLAHGAPARVGRLRAYGNAIVAPQAAEVIRAFMECRP